MTFGMFKEWLMATENKVGNKLKHLRTDNGLDFVSEEFNNFCKSKGITRHRTVKHTPQQNGVAERMNRTLLERVRCMLIHAGLPKSFWGEAISTAAYLVNRSPSSAIDFKTPLEMWYGKPADYRNLRAFGCQAYAHIKQDKLEPRALKCIFIGYPEGVKGYKLRCLESGYKRCLISRDVVFDELKMANLQQFNVNPQNLESQRSRVEVELHSNSDTSMQQQGPMAETSSEVQDSDNEEDGNLAHYNVARDRQRRQIRPPAGYAQADVTSFALNIAEVIHEIEPRSYKEVLKSNQKQKWIKAMNEEMDSLNKNQTWDLVPRPKSQKVIGCRWIYKKKD